jgi:hypothetical protein
MKEPYDWDEYAKMYFPKAEELAKIAEEAEKVGEKEKASEYYLYEQDSQNTWKVEADCLQTKLCRLAHLSIPNAPIQTAEICLGGG